VVLRHASPVKALDATAKVASATRAEAGDSLTLQMEVVMQAEYIRERVKCCACGGSLTTSPHVNLVTLRRRATWEFPTSGNVLTGEENVAVAIVCDECFEHPVRHAVEFAGNEVIYHPLDTLEDLGPAATHVLLEETYRPRDRMSRLRQEKLQSERCPQSVLRFLS